MTKSAGILLALCLMTLTAALATGCATDEAGADEAEPYVEHDESSDFDPVYDSKADGVVLVFDRHHVMEDGFFVDGAFLTADALQLMLEQSPYDNRSWLADATFDGRSAATILADAAVEFDINPLVLLARLQTEASLVSKSVRPSSGSINRAMGCGCFDGQACQSAYSGFENQVRCGARTMRDRYDDSVEGSAQWRVGHTERTLDGHSITPKTHATASLYAYTPWVLQGRGGTWLAWNITRKYEQHALTLGLTEVFETPWIGSTCTTDDDCADIVDGEYTGECLLSAPEATGFCVLPCEGYCPDRAGEPTTFCTALPELDGGRCVQRAEAANDQCADLEGTRPVSVSRYVGDSGASERTAEVCLSFQ